MFNRLDGKGYQCEYGKEWLEILKLISCLIEDTSTFIRPYIRIPVV